MNEKNIMSIIKVSRVAFVSQLVVIVSIFLIVPLLGSPPHTAQEAFGTMSQNQFAGLLRDDLYNIVLISLYLFSFSGLYFILKDHKFTLTFFAVFLSFCAVILALSSHSGFSLLHLSKLYEEAADSAMREVFLSAGESVIAQNMWNSSAGYFTGIFLQGGGILISLAMIGHGGFSKLTIFCGIMGNGLDLIQHLIHPFLPSVSQAIMYVMGPFYLLWFVMLVLNLSRFIRTEEGSKGVRE